MVLIAAGWLGWLWAIAGTSGLLLISRLDRYFDPRFRKEIPEESVREFVYRLLACNYVAVSPGEYHEAEVYEVVKRIIVEKAGVDPREVHRKATIGRDLGMD